MQYIYISYADKDKFVADAMLRHLESCGIRCRTFRSLSPQDQARPDALRRILSQAEAVILIFSGAANVSASVLREMEFAVQCTRTVIPFRLDHSPVNKDLEYLLGNVHWLDTTTDSLPSNLEALCGYLQVLRPGNSDATGSQFPTKSAPRMQAKWITAGIAAALVLLVILVLGSRGPEPDASVSMEHTIPPMTEEMTAPQEPETETTSPQPQIQEISYLGGTYCGTLEDTLPHGEGTLTWSEGYYEGSFVDGYPHGTGIFYFSDGSLAEGDDWSWGTAELDMLLGEYSGMLLNGQASGYGTLYLKYGARFDGTFDRDYPWGDGIYTACDGSCVSGFWKWAMESPSSWLPQRQGADMFYTGMVCDGVFSGLGFLIFQSGGSFMGEFFCGDPCGWGVYSYRNPRSEEDRLMQGDCWITVYGDKRLEHDYYGLKLNGKWQGFGIGIMKSGYAYCGEILDDYRDGYGELYTAKDTLERRAIYRKGNSVERLPTF